MEVKLSDLNDIFSKAFGEPITVTENTVRDDISVWDSINQLNLIIELEDFYHISFSMDEIKDINSVKKVIDTIQAK